MFEPYPGPMPGDRGVVDMALLSVIHLRDRMGRDAAEDDVNLRLGSRVANWYAGSQNRGLCRRLC